MKTILTVLALGALATHSAFARIGESVEEITARYGEGKKHNDRLKAPGAETWRYVKGGFNITVVFLNGKSVWEMFERKDKLISEADIEELLKVNSMTGRSWRFDKRENRWERGGPPKLIGMREPGHPDFFSIKDLEAIKAVETANKPGKSGF